ncbi:MAG: rhomboid family intramembrane serine protease [Acidobacteriota bacterium]|nr:rhomboid family intramembrane serine protease [Acidobacteriota bacterium]
MRYDIRYRSRSSFFGASFPQGVKWLIAVNVAIYLLYFFLYRTAGDVFIPLKLVPTMVVHGAVWQLVTYLFLHDPTGLMHILLNMLVLWMFGAPVEETWGTRRFLQFYFLCGVGAGVCVVVVNLLIGNIYQPTIGASGAIYGLLLAYGMLFPNQEVLFMFLFPMKAKYMVMIFGAIAFLGSFQGGSTVSNLAHLGGMIFGFIYIRTQFSQRRPARRTGGGGRSFDPGKWWKDYKMARARKKFQVYMKNHGSDRDPWVN